ncbi:hypothetical protein SISNIDRAFT_487892 [Sistotremastrum niveocremeum HHB9708]|uniref:Tetraspanin n=1 Tax=Sistotremastrum niveocremeum HHB9708 TaxID=1314777 RepID=A0A164RTP0_9AGAM|nr:hypothetical protein SISNIDRAFT_487892 [Sistotremastrum niveocremeum HHB9708]
MSVFNPFTDLRNKATAWFTTTRTLTVLYTFFLLILLISGATMTASALSYISLPPPSSYSPPPLSQSSSPSSTSHISLVPLIFNNTQTYTLLVLGVIVAATSLLSVPPLLQTSNSQSYLLLLNLWHVVELLILIIGGSIIWWGTLRERNEFWSVWQANGDFVRGIVQERFSCCGYWNNTDLSQVVPLGICELAASTISVPSTENMPPPCVNAFQAYGDSYLNGWSTAVYAFAAILCGQFMVTACMIADRKLLERFRKIDLKYKIIV